MARLVRNWEVAIRKEWLETRKKVKNNGVAGGR